MLAFKYDEYLVDKHHHHLARYVCVQPATETVSYCYLLSPSASFSPFLHSLAFSEFHGLQSEASQKQWPPEHTG